MARPMTADQTLAAMKKWHVPYIEYPGWKTRGRPASTGPFDDARGIMIHHTGSDAGQSDAYLKFLFVDGRSDLPAPLCNVSTDMDGDLHLGATGRANHAGRGSAAVLAKVTTEDWTGYTSEARPGADSADGNAHFYGNEVRYDGGQPMTAKQYAAAVRWAAAVCDFHGWSALSIIGHREWTLRKPDPGNCPMNKFRSDVAVLLKAGPPKSTTPDTTPTPVTPPKDGFTVAEADRVIDFIKSQDALTGVDGSRWAQEIEESRTQSKALLAAIAKQSASIDTLTKTVATLSTNVGLVKAKTDKLP